ncbi:hypothetical protein SBV1_950024 [Verrucomicrobia bacterium]|nr:hypothetical protein SBV1_950024 [Verrucomicrobiota bacterium]
MSLVAGSLCWLGLRASKSAASRESAPNVAPLAQAASPTRAAGSASPDTASRPAGRFKYRLTNTSLRASELVRSDKAVLLENAVFDTSRTVSPAIPAHLRAQGDPGSYIIQTGRPLDNVIRAKLNASGAIVVSYIPNNAVLVRASAAVAQELAGDPLTTVLPYEPYYKLKASLLETAVEQAPLPSSSVLNVLLFSDAREATVQELQRMGVELIGEDPSPFGPVLALRAAQPGDAALLPALARLPGVQEIELAHPRVPANDLSRVTLRVASDTQSAQSYLGLTGSNVFINVNDTGIDTNHPDLQGRVIFDSPTSGVDSNGHGTHVAGTIGGNGSRSATVSDAEGSVNPPVSGQFRGLAPGATLFSLLATPQLGPALSDSYLQQTAAQTNALLGGGPFISNNSWNYDNDNQYDLPAASYDAAVRDALPQVSGSQPGLYVFAAGNTDWTLNHWGDGNGSQPDGILSPGTAKNVITVGAVEQLRNITNPVVQCTTTNGQPCCVTNQPFLPSTDASNQVAGFSSWGNAGIGIEGESGRYKPDVVAPGAFVISTRSTQWDQETYYSPTNEHGDFLTVLSNLNATLAPYYRFESGTSMAAAEVSGMLALMQEFFEQRLGLTNSPALMKALLINGARSLGAPYDLRVCGATNQQGWGLIDLPNSLGTLTNLQPAAPSGSMFLFDQDPAGALTTGQSRTRFISLNSEAAQDQPLRVTLVWTDPPANPVAGIKLVNSLYLVVTNLDTGAVYFGNDIPAHGAFNQPWDTNAAPPIDLVNNVQTVYVQPPLGSNYSVSVAANRVNVNALSDSPADAVQDYALVISAGEGQVPDALTLTNSTPLAPPAIQPLVTVVGNSFESASPGDAGELMIGQRVGATAPSVATNTVPLAPGVTNAALTIGTTNQWHFYIVTNQGGPDFTNAAFATFQARLLSLPRTEAAGATSSTNAAPTEADIDLYVSTDPTLTNLSPTAIAEAYRSVSRGGAESIVLYNAVPGSVYYAGVKSERQEGAEYNFLADFSNVPFGQSDAQGNQYLRGIPQQGWIPDATTGLSGEVAAGGWTNLCLPLAPIQVRRVIVTNNIGHQLMSDLVGTLNQPDGNSAKYVVLNNHLPNFGATNQYVYDDSGESNIAGARHTDGPGSLNSFAGEASGGLPWMLTESDTVIQNVGYDSNLTVFLEQQQSVANGITVTVEPGTTVRQYLDVPVETTNLTVYGQIISGIGPVSMEVCRKSGAGCQAAMVSGGGTSSVTLDAFSNPVLQPGHDMVVALSNLSGQPVTLWVSATLELNLNGVTPMVVSSRGPTPIADDAVSYSTINVTNVASVQSLEVGVRLDHPRVSDLALTLISPAGQRVLLFENRGGATTNGLGFDLVPTNPASFYEGGGPQPQTNIFDLGQTSGSFRIDYQFYSEPDTMYVYYGGLDASNLLWTSGFVPFTGTTNLSYSGNSTVITIIMNQFGNPAPDDIWEYTLTSTILAPQYVTFTENTNLTTVPIKFAPPPFTNSVAITVAGPAIMSDSFETGTPGYVAPGSGNFSGGWLLNTGDAFLLTNGSMPGFVCDSGRQCADLIGSNSAAISTNLSLTPGSNYVLSFAFAPNPDSVAQGIIPQAAVTLDSTVLLTLAAAQSNSWANPEWQTTSVVFTAQSPSQMLQVQALNACAGILVDSFRLQPERVQSGIYYLPEESLDRLCGQAAAGAWQLEIADTLAGPGDSPSVPRLVSWNLSFLLDPPASAPMALQHGESQTLTLGPGAIQVFSVAVPGWAERLTNWLVSATGPVNLLFDQNIAPTGTNPGDYTLLAGLASGVTTLATNTSPPLIPGSSCYLAVQNTNAVSVTFTLQIDFDVTTLSNGVPLFCAPLLPGQKRCFAFNADPTATALSLQILAPQANVDLAASLGLPFPTLASNDYASFNPGTNNQQIIVFANSQPVGLSPGTWYVVAANSDTAPGGYTMLAMEYTNVFPSIIELQSGVPYPNMNSGGPDYYLYEVSTNALRAQFEITQPSGPVALVARKGLPLPDLASYDLAAANPGSNDQSIVFCDDSSPLSLTPGPWFLSVVNLSGMAMAYTVLAADWPVCATNIVITSETAVSNNLCLTWTSLPGFDYVVQGQAGGATNWIDASGMVTATNYSTTWCTPLPAPFAFFRVAELAEPPASPLTPVNVTGISVVPQGLLLQWTAPPASQFQVQWSPTLPAVPWNTFNGLVSSTNGSFSFLDDGSQTGGIGPARFYRLLQLP